MLITILGYKYNNIIYAINPNRIYLIGYRDNISLYFKNIIEPYPDVFAGGMLLEISNDSIGKYKIVRLLRIYSYIFLPENIMGNISSCIPSFNEYFKKNKMPPLS